MRTSVSLAAVTIVAITGLAFLLWVTFPSFRYNDFKQTQTPTEPDQSQTATTPTTAQPDEPAYIAVTSDDQGGFKTGLENMPASFKGTQPDGQWQQDHQGNLVINNDILHIFNYFLSAQGEEPLSSSISRIQAHIDSHLAEPAASQAKQLLSDYLALNSRIAALNSVATSPPNTPDLIADRLQLISELRKSYLSPGVAEIFYANEENLDQFALNKMKIEHNKQLTVTEKAVQIEQLESQLPPEIQQSLDRTRIAVKLNQLTQKLRNSRASSEEVLRLRSEMVGDEAAERLQELDYKRAQWEANLQAWYNARSKLRNNPQLSALDKEQQISQLRGDYFDTNEIRRVMVLEKIHDTSH